MQTSSKNAAYKPYTINLVTQQLFIKLSKIKIVIA